MQLHFNPMPMPQFPGVGGPKTRPAMPKPRPGGPGAVKPPALHPGKPTKPAFPGMKGDAFKPTAAKDAPKGAEGAQKDAGEKAAGADKLQEFVNRLARGAQKPL